jgi:LysM repeat protein
MLLVNGSGDEMKVKPGMVICIPCFSSQSAKVADSQRSVKNRPIAKANLSIIAEREESETKVLSKKRYHVVKKGETLSTIAGMYGIDKANLRSTNNLINDKIHPDMKLKLASYVQKKEQRGTRYHIVKKGETLSMISSKYGTNVSDLRSANNLKNDLVYPNMRLKIVVGQG